LIQPLAENTPTKQLSTANPLMFNSQFHNKKREVNPLTPIFAIRVQL